MTDIIRSQKEISGASTAVLIATYNQLTGKSIKKFSSRAAAESQVANAILSAEAAAGKLGVAKGASPVALTKDEIKAKASGKADAAPAPAPVAKPAKGKSLRASLAAKAGDAPPNKGRPKVERKPTSDGSRAATLLAVTFAANPSGARLNTGSIRSEIAAWMKKRVERAAERGDDSGRVTVEEVVKKFGPQGRQALQKMIMLGHLDAVRAERAPA